MSRRRELENEIELIRNKLGNAPEDTPENIKGLWIKELDSLSFELDNLYDDDENEFPY